ncbi:hypothetical protein F5Y15DRAFT_411668 [Xylariaceae sp. FL0016]|nr:hypothetical protein F5Y15DRAFT_411668 [Xylariaceae sp. FL0016]
MALSPLSLTRSPSSSPNTNYSASPSLDLDYPSPDLVDPLYKIASMYEQPSCAAVSTNMDAGNSFSPLGAMTSAEWTGTAVIRSGSSAGAPTVLAADYDPFANFEPTLHTPYSHDLYSSHAAVQAATLSNTPPPLASHSSRSSDPSSRHSFSYHSASPIPRIKMENAAADYASGAELSQYPSPHSTHAMPVEPNSYASNAGSSAGYLSDVPSGSWKTEYPSLEPDQYYTAGANSSPGPSSSLLPERRSSSLRAPRAPRRQPRKLTTKEEANFQCEVKGCGKLFSRSYNYKAHMETHDEKREYPFPCTAPDCNKKFVRKTDLQRHNQSVHLKERSHLCDYCGRKFARKDTLRRHMEDGCSKRFDIPISNLDLRGAEAGYDSYGAQPRHYGNPPGHLAAPAQQLPPMTMPHTHSSHLLSPNPPYMKR